MTTPWYDTREGLERRLETGLAGVREIYKARRDAGYERKERMAEWCLLGRFWLDTCGNFSVIEHGAPAAAQEFLSYERRISPLMTREEAHRFSETMTSTGANVPGPDDKCGRCGRGWTMENLHDVYWVRDTGFRHTKCHKLAVIDREITEITRYFVRAEVPYSEMRMIPSQYHSDDMYFGPWFMVETPAGVIQIGWRKRVCNIDWSRTGLPARGGHVVEDPKITHGPTYVHAYGEDKVVEALRKLWASKPKEG